MKVTFIAFTKIRGGAAKAAVRLNDILNEKGVDAPLVTIEDNKVPVFYKITHYVGWFFSHLLTKLQKSDNPTKHSLNIFGSAFILDTIKKSELLHIHWVNNETLSINNFPILSHKSVITLHDEWFYCGAEHYALDDSSFLRVTHGYYHGNKNVKGVDLNRFIWNEKVKHYQSLSGVIFTVPSTWMQMRARKSVLLRDKDIRVVPNPINTNVFKKNTVGYQIEGIDKHDFVITFGAIGGTASKIKGFDLLSQAIEEFAATISGSINIKIIIFGGKIKRRTTMFGIDTFEVGHIASECELANIYSLSSVTVVPSRVESFGQVAAESLSCETPVVSFNCTGLTDIVEHKLNGYLATPFDSSSLCEGLLWIYNLNIEKRLQLGQCGRVHVIDSFCQEVVGRQLISIYKELGYK